MADLSQLESALVKADAAGDVEGARTLAGEIRRMRQFQAIKSDEPGFAQYKPTPFKPSGETALSGGEEVLANPYGRAAVGALKPIIGTGQLALNAIGQGEGINREMQNLQQSTQKAREYVGSQGVDLADLAGQSATFGLAAAKLPNAASTLGRVWQGGASGAASGAMEPVSDPNNYWGTKGTQIGGGAVAGTLLPGAWEVAKLGGRSVRNVVQPYMGEWGANRAAGRLANAAGGDKADAIIQNLRQPQTLVPGSNPTAGQAAAPAGSAEFSALQKLASERDPSAYYALDKAQAQARTGAVQKIGGTPNTLALAQDIRSTAAKQNYDAAWNTAVKADPELLAISQNPFFKSALRDAKRLAQAEGISPKTDLTQFLHFVKLSLDKQVAKVGDTALSRTEQRAVTDITDRLVDWMGRKNPAYENARSVFQAQSRPIDQMKLGQQLEAKLNPALGTKQRAFSFSEALRKSAEEGDLAVLGRNQVSSLRNVSADLARDAERKSLAQAGMPEAQRIVDKNFGKAPPSGFFSPVVSVARGLYNRAAGGASEETMKHLAIQMRDPQKLARLMKEAKPFERRALVDALMRYQATVPVQMGNQ